MGKRKDLKGLTTVTIDGERAKDFDDAVSITLTEAWIPSLGAYPMSVPTSDEFGNRPRGPGGVHQHLSPDRVIPMLPRNCQRPLQP